MSVNLADQGTGAQRVQKLRYGAVGHISHPAAGQTSKATFLQQDDAQGVEERFLLCTG